LALASIDPLIVGLGRAVIAAGLGAMLLWFTGQPSPTTRQWRHLFITGLGVVVGFPLLSALALKHVPASHGAVIIAIVPLATAVVGVMRTHERPSALFWMASLAGSVVLVSYALHTSAGKFSAADLLLLGAVASVAIGYVEGARLARELGGWQVICWALLAMLPLIGVPVTLAVWQNGFHPTPVSLAGFIYVSVVSMFLGFFAWYHGLAVGGVARVSQLQLAQTFLTLMFSSLLLGEKIEPLAVLCAVAVVAAIVITRISKVNSGSALPDPTPPTQR
jgi:drug/metabolite transporter (DMT)-like permease